MCELALKQFGHVLANFFAACQKTWHSSRLKNKVLLLSRVRKLCSSCLRAVRNNCCYCYTAAVDSDDIKNGRRMCSVHRSATKHGCNRRGAYAIPRRSGAIYEEMQGYHLPSVCAITEEESYRQWK